MINTEQMTKLRLKTLRQISGFSNHPSLPKVINGYFSAVQKYNIASEVKSLNDSQGNPIAFFLPSRFYHRFYGHLICQHIFDYDSEHEEQAISFLLEQLKINDQKKDLQLLEVYGPAKNFVSQLSSWKLGATSFAGDPKTSLIAIKPKLTGQLQKLGLTIQEVEDDSEIESIMKIKSKCFKANAELCWFWNCDQYQSQEYLRLINSIGKKQTFVVKNKETIVGYVGLHFDFESTYWGPSSGIDLLLNPKFQGKKLSYELYQFAFEKMIQSKIILYKGATANPVVLKLGAVMDRWVIYHQLVKDSQEKPILG